VLAALAATVQVLLLQMVEPVNLIQLQVQALHEAAAVLELPT
jgi:hypothetical protein